MMHTNQTTHLHNMYKNEPVSGEATNIFHNSAERFSIFHWVFSSHVNDSSTDRMTSLHNFNAAPFGRNKPSRKKTRNVHYHL